MPLTSASYIMLPTSADFLTALGIILNAQPAKQLLLLHVQIEVTKPFYSTYFSAFLMVGTKSLCITSPRVVPLQQELSLLQNASICISHQRSFFQTAECNPGLGHSRLDNLGS